MHFVVNKFLVWIFLGSVTLNMFLFSGSFSSSKSLFDNKKAIRGGIPIVFRELLSSFVKTELKLRWVHDLWEICSLRQMCFVSDMTLLLSNCFLKFEPTHLLIRYLAFTEWKRNNEPAENSNQMTVFVSLLQLASVRGSTAPNTGLLA